MSCGTKGVQLHDKTIVSLNGKFAAYIEECV